MTEPSSSLTCGWVPSQTITMSNCTTNPTDPPCDRSYRLYIPLSLCDENDANDDNNNNDDAIPLLFAIHSFNADGSTMVDFQYIADNFHMALVIPEGLDRSWNAVNCCGKSLERGIDDFGFLSRILTDITTEYSLLLRPDAVYAVGYSNGGYMVTRSARLFRAVSNMAGYIYDDMTKYVDLNRRTEFLMFHGVRDNVVRFEGCCTEKGYERCCCGISQTASVCKGVDKFFDEWSWINECSGDVSDSLIMDDKGMTCTSGVDCKFNSTLCVYEDKEHQFKIDYDMIGDFFARNACEIVGGGEWLQSDRQCLCQSGTRGTYCLLNGTVSVNNVDNLRENITGNLLNEPVAPKKNETISAQVIGKGDSLSENVIGNHNSNSRTYQNNVNKNNAVVMMTLIVTMMTVLAWRIKSRMVQYRGFSQVAVNESDEEDNVELLGTPN